MLSFVVGTVRLYATVERFNVGIDGRLELRLGMFILYYTTLTFSTGLVFVKEPPFVFEGKAAFSSSLGCVWFGGAGGEGGVVWWRLPQFLAIL